jgi:hypothetical protein
VVATRGAAQGHRAANPAVVGAAVAAFLAAEARLVAEAEAVLPSHHAPMLRRAVPAGRFFQ